MIDGIELKQLKINADERGSLMEVWRDDWEFYGGEDAPAMSYVSITYPGIVRAWHRHKRGQIDHFIVPQGKIKVGIFDDRKGSETRGELNTYIIGEGCMEAIRIPGACWHGFKAVGDSRSTLLNFPTNLYDYEDPDEERLPYDTDEIPLDWDENPHE